MTGNAKENIKVGILDLGKNLEGHTPTERIAATVGLARRAEEIGLESYWLAEHHVPNSAYCAPEVVISLLAASTDRIRLGHAGLLLRYYSPLKVAEVYLTLEAAFPGRIDLGVCRGPGLVESRVGLDLVYENAVELSETSFEVKVEELVKMFQRTPSSSERNSWGPFPALGERPKMWLFGSSRRSAEIAIRNHLPFGAMLFQANSAEYGPRVMSEYRQKALHSFEPTSAITVSVLCGPTESAALRRANILAKHGMEHRIVGTAAYCAKALTSLAASCAADVVAAATFSYDVEDHLALIEGLGLLAKDTGHAPQSEESLLKTGN